MNLETTQQGTVTLINVEGAVVEDSIVFSFSKIGAELPSQQTPPPPTPHPSLTGQIVAKFSEIVQPIRVGEES